MTDPQEKSTPTVRVREPKKKTQDTFANLRQPHPVEELLGLVTTPSVHPTPSGGQGDRGTDPLSPPPLTPSEMPETPVAPERDYNKRANSLERDALPSGIFPGSSKKIYDALYLRTRGSIKPVRTVRATKKDIADWSGVRNRKTIDGHLRYLETFGLVIRQWEVGNNEGYMYEVRLPEETLGDRGGQGDRGGLSPSVQKWVRGSDQKRDRGGQSQVSDLSTIYESPKTFIKTIEKTDDDEAFAAMNSVLNEVTKSLTGKAASGIDAERWRELGEVLIAELKIAAARTTISSVPAFLAEHLRRRLWKLDKKQAHAEGRELPDDDSTSTAGEQAGSCLDCRGSGWWYPDGLERGVAKCAHLKLSQAHAPDELD